MMKEKRGEIQLQEVVSFFVLNALFFSMCFFFVYKSGSGAGNYEEIYSKKIALAIDQARANSTLFFSFDKLANIAKKSGISIEEAVKIDNERNRVIVRLSSGKGASYEFFSDVRASPIIVGNSLRIRVEK